MLTKVSADSSPPPPPRTLLLVHHQLSPLLVTQLSSQSIRVWFNCFRAPFEVFAPHLHSLRPGGLSLATDFLVRHLVAFRPQGPPRHAVFAVIYRTKNLGKQLAQGFMGRDVIVVESRLKLFLRLRWFLCRFELFVCWSHDVVGYYALCRRCLEAWDQNKVLN